MQPTRRPFPQEPHSLLVLWSVRSWRRRVSVRTLRSCPPETPVVATKPGLVTHPPPKSDSTPPALPESGFRDVLPSLTRVDGATCLISGVTSFSLDPS